MIRFLAKSSVVFLRVSYYVLSFVRHGFFCFMIFTLRCDLCVITCISHAQFK
nr:MAG TPA: hypothetical protein [Caudoviricetes sp.]